MTIFTEIKAFIAILVLVTLIGTGLWHHHEDVKVQTELASTKVQLNASLDAQHTLQTQLETVTEDKKALDTQIAASDKVRALISQTLAATLKKLHDVPAPVTCPAQIDWLYDGASQ